MDTKVTAEVRPTGSPANCGHDDVVFTFENEHRIHEWGPNGAREYLALLIAGPFRPSADYWHAAGEILSDLASSNVEVVEVRSFDDEIAVQADGYDRCFRCGRETDDSWFCSAGYCPTCCQETDQGGDS